MSRKDSQLVENPTRDLLAMVEQPPELESSFDMWVQKMGFTTADGTFAFDFTDSTYGSFGVAVSTTIHRGTSPTSANN